MPAGRAAPTRGPAVTSGTGSSPRAPALPRGREPMPVARPAPAGTGWQQLGVPAAPLGQAEPAAAQVPTRIRRASAAPAAGAVVVERAPAARAGGWPVEPELSALPRA